MFGYAVITGLVIDLIAGPILGGYPSVGSHLWVLWPEFAFIAFAVALLAATLQSLVGPMGTLLAVIIVVFIGNPSTGGVNGVAYQPLTFFSWTGFHVKGKEETGTTEAPENIDPDEEIGIAAIPPG